MWLLVAAQIAIPASYYVERAGRDDERFAWRMFSAIRLKRCSVDAFDGELDAEAPRIDVSRAIHASWSSSLARGRHRVIEAFLATRCSRPEVGVASLTRRCRSPSGRRLPVHLYRYECATRRFSQAQ